MAGERRVPANPLTVAGARILVAPFQLWLDGADHLRLEGWSAAANTTLQVYGRVLTEDITIEVFQMFLFVPDTRVRFVANLPLPKGFLLNAVVTVTGSTPLLGQVFGRLSIIRGFTGATLIFGTLLQGYVTSNQALSWPGSPIANTDSIDGYRRLVTQGAAAAGNPVFFSCPAGAEWLLLSATCQLQCSAAAANRRPFVIPASGNPPYVAHHMQVLTAGNNQQCFWANGLTGNVDQSNQWNTTALPVRTVLDNTSDLVISATNLQAGDQFTSSHLHVLERLQVT